MRTSTVIGIIAFTTMAGLALQGPLAKSMTADRPSAIEIELAKWEDVFGSVKTGLDAQYLKREMTSDQVEQSAKRFHANTTEAFRKRGYFKHLVDTGAARVDTKLRNVHLIVEIDPSIRLGHINGLELAFFDRLCSPWLGSAMGQNDYALRFRLTRPNGAIIFNQTVSASACDQFSSFQNRRSS